MNQVIYSFTENMLLNIREKKDFLALYVFLDILFLIHLSVKIEGSIAQLF